MRALLAWACVLCAAQGRAACAVEVLDVLREDGKAPPEVRPFLAEGRTRDLVVGLRTMVPEGHGGDWYALSGLLRVFDGVERGSEGWYGEASRVRRNLQEILRLHGRDFGEMMDEAGRRALFPCPSPCAADFGRFRLRALDDPRIADLAGRAPLENLAEMRRSLGAELGDSGVGLSYERTAVGLLVALVARRGEDGARGDAGRLVGRARDEGVRSLFWSDAGGNRPHAPWEPVLFGGAPPGGAAPVTSRGASGP